MKLIFFVLSVLILILYTKNVESWGPNFHLNVTTEGLMESEPTLIKQLIVDNLDGCYAGLIYADVGIFYYYTNFKLYRGLHNYNTVDEILRLAENNKERAFAYCFKIHLAEDSISHNFFVPAAIKRTKIPNYIIHPIVELRIEGLYLNPIANRLMERHAEYDKLVEKATGRDWSSEASKLNTILGGGNFYTQAFAADSSTFIGRTQNKLFKFVALFVSDKSVIDYYRLSVDAAKGVIRGETNNLDPSGEKALREADKSTQLTLYIVTILIIIVIFWISVWRRWI